MNSFLKVHLKLLIVITLQLVSLNLFSQYGTIRGFVYDKSTGEPIIFTNVFLVGTNYGGTTDLNGFFTISRVPPGEYTLRITFVGYDTINEPIVLKKDEIINKRFYMEKSAVKLQTIEISAEKQSDLSETKTSVIKVTPKQISKIPTIGGTPDLAQYIQVLPGVIFTGDQGGQIYIRGGAPIHNKILLDGLTIFNPFHSIGLFSVFETDIIRNIDIYTGGFGAEFGSRISSIMNITTRDGNKLRYSGSIGATPFGSKAIIEGPLKKLNLEDGTSSSFILTFKNSYLKNSSKLFYSYVDKDGLPFNFLDIYSKISLNTESGSKLNLFGFRFTDDVLYRNVATYSWLNSGMGASFILVPAGSNMLIDGAVGYSNYEISLTDESNKPKQSAINGFQVNLGFGYFMKNHTIKYGLEALANKTSFLFYNAADRKISQEQYTTELGLFFKDKITTKKFIFEPGLRWQYYASLSDDEWEPRFAMKYLLNNTTRIKFATGLYSQHLIASNSDRDVVNLFYGFLSGPENLPHYFKGKEVTHKLQKSQHFILGLEKDITKNSTINIEPYYKYFPQLTAINRNKLFDDTEEYSDTPELLRKDYIVEKGNAYGIDFLLKHETRIFYFWCAYSLAFVDRIDEQHKYKPHYDRRHNINLVTTYVFGDKRNSEISFRWNFGSGFPFPKNLGHYPLITFSNGINSNILEEEQTLGTIFSPVNDGRLPTYHRLDVSFKHTHYFTENTKLETIVAVTNIYNRKNVFYFDRLTKQRINQLPILPSLGVTLSF